MMHYASDLLFVIAWLGVFIGAVTGIARGWW